MNRLPLLIFAFLITITSCSDDENPADLSGDIVGRWIATDIEFTGSGSFETASETINYSVDGQPVNLDHALTFTASPNEVVSEGGFSLEVTSTINGQTESETVDGESLVETGNWEQNGNILTIINSEDGGDIEIFELTATRLVIGSDVSERETADGVTITLNSTFRMIYRRE